MKKISILFLLLLASTAVLAQKKERLKGSRVVTSAVREIADFENLEVEDNIEVFLSQGDKSELEIEADDNLHDAIIISENAGTLRISVSKETFGAKKLSVRIAFTPKFRMLVAKDDAYVTALTDINLDNFTFKSSGNTRIFANVRAKTFTLMANDRSKAELNITADNTMVELNKTSQLKALIASPKMKFDMYLKSIATVEGDVDDLKLRIDNNANFTGKNLTAKIAEVIAEANANVSLNVMTNATLEVTGKAEIELYGEQKIIIRKFTDNASIRKRAIK